MRESGAVAPHKQFSFFFLFYKISAFEWGALELLLYQELGSKSSVSQRNHRIIIKVGKDV